MSEVIPRISSENELFFLILLLRNILKARYFLGFELHVQFSAAEVNVPRWDAAGKPTSFKNILQTQQ